MRQWLELVKEATYATYDGSAIAADKTWVRLASDGAFSMIPQVEAYTIKSYDARAEAIQYGTNRTLLAGTLTTPFYGSQADLFLRLATGLVGTGSPPNYDLPSFTINHYDGVRTRRYLGCKIASATLNIPTSGPATWSFSVVAHKPDATNPTLAEPAGTVFPAATDLPFTLQDTAGGFKVGSNTPRTKYNSITCTFTNVLSGEQTESPYLTHVYGGRDITFGSTFWYESGETDRAAYESATALTIVDLTVARSGGYSVLFDWKGQGRITGYSNNLPMGQKGKASLTVMSMFDPTPSASFSFTVTPPA